MKLNKKLTYLTLVLMSAMALSPTHARAQTGARITFGINPGVFRAGQPASAELCLTSVSATPITLSAGNTFTFFLDSSLGAVGSFTTPLSVSSASLLPGDFSVSFGANHNQILVTYNGAPKSFAFGDSFSVKITFSVAVQPGTAKISLSSQFDPGVNGNLPFTTASIIDFANSGTSSVAHDQSLSGDGTAATPLGIAPGGVTAADIAAGQVVKSLNGLTDNVSIVGGANVTVTPGAGSLTLSVPSAITSIAHDGTLAGNGTAGMPLGVVGGSVAIAHDGTMTGNGTTGTPLGVVGGSVSVAHDGTLTGNGTTGTPLGVNAGSVAVTTDATMTGNGTSGSPLGVKAGSATVTTDGTLTGNGTGGTPLGIKLPLNLEGALSGNVSFNDNALDDLIGGVFVKITNTKGNGLAVFGGYDPTLKDSLGQTSGGVGVFAVGGGPDCVQNGVGVCIDGSGIVAHPGGLGGGSNGDAADLEGNVGVSGNFFVAGNKSFKIDHPLDPANKYLYHSSVESPDQMNIYNGNVKLDSNGEAVVELPVWFGALNTDYRYLLTPIGGSGPGLYIAEEIADNRFKIAGGAPGMKVSWQVTGIRQDAWAAAHRMPVEEMKSDRERGYYFHPELYGQPEEKSLAWARHPEFMKMVKERREQQMKQAQAAAAAPAAHSQPGRSKEPAKGTPGND
jgi:hypothetical protein